MNDQELRALLDLLMCSDPYPTCDRGEEILKALARRESINRGYDGWIDAYHRMGVPL
jgi:hypothetical protein